MKPLDVEARYVLSGYIVDAVTGEALPGAHVYVPGLRVGASTNDAGYFAVPSLPRGDYLVRISYVGYRTYVLELPAGRSVSRIALEPAAVETAAVYVEATRGQSTSTSDVPGLIAASVGELERLPSFPGERDLFQALQWFAGIRNSGEISGGLVVRGSEPDQNLYLLDGVPIYYPWHAFSLISTFQTETFKDIKFYRGVFPAEYGGRLSSVLDAQMKDGNRSSPRAVAGLSLLSGRLLVETPLSRGSSLMLSGRRSYLDTIIGREHPVTGADGMRDTLRTGYYFYDTSAKYTWHLHDQHRIAFSFYRGGDNLDLRLPFDLSLDFSSWLRPADLFFEIDQVWANQLFSTRYQGLLGSRFFVTGTAYRSSYRAVEGAFMQPTASAELVSQYEVGINDLGLKVDFEYFHALDHQIEAGVQIVERRFRSALDATVQRSPSAVDTMAENSRLHAAELVAYVQDTWRPGPLVKVQPGLRVSFFGDGRHISVDPGVNLQYALLPRRLTVKAGAGTQVQYLHRLRDRYSFVYDLVSSRWIPASSEVKPATGVQASGGIEVRPYPWLTVGAEAYARSARNILLPEDQFRTKDGLSGPGIEVGTLLGQYVYGRNRAYGLELSADVLRGSWNLMLNYAGGRSLDRPINGADPYRPARFDVPRSFSGVVTRSGGRWDLTVAADFRSGYPHSVPVARYALGDPLDDEPRRYMYRPYVNNGRLPPYFRLDLAVAYRFEALGARWRVQGQLYNATNRRNVLARQYDPAPDVVGIRDRRSVHILPLFDIEIEI
jgi:hypothetical protein